MLHKATHLKGATVAGLDGEIGVVDEVFIDDEHWHVRYLGIKTRGWPGERRALIPPEAIRRETSSDTRLEVDLMRSEVLEGPLFDFDKPLSRRQERAYAAYYGHRPYWDGADTGEAPPASALAQLQTESDATPRDAASACHVHSSRKLVGYAMTSRDGQVGQVEDLLIDEESWSVQQLIVDTTRWLPGGQITVPASLARSIDSEKELVRVDADSATLDKLSAHH